PMPPALYSSEVKFILRGPNKAPTSAISAMLSSPGAAGGSEDTYAVLDYITSRDAARRLEREVDLRALLSRPEGDLITRFPGIWFWRHDFEALYSSYLRFISVERDSNSSVSTLAVKAYRPEDAHRIARALLEFSEQRTKITGDSDSVATALTEYERLDVQKLLAEKTLASALVSLESAKLEAQKQQLYLETIAQPNLADYPLYPKRAISFATVVVSCLLAYGIAWLLIASVREHASA